ncbi:WxL domain-containing protein [Listeria booriae]|uniref:WxL domain-containing protein n=1 Tax=Listeria booriae TaxID=1552123 RepID=UPI001628E31E|nr:WxL domain-containing protein [Listeria booriae]MBC1290829.1 WxL domain-containing protein [Listeria booriae]
MNKFSKLALVGIVAAGSLAIYASPSFAAEVGSTTSKADITFKDDDGTTPTNPVDPTNPNDNVTPTDPDAPKPTTGKLRLDYVSNIHFGEQTISGSDTTYKAKYDEVLQSDGVTKKYVPTFAQVTDNRGTNAGWKLQVSNDQFKAGTEELTGAVLTLKDATLNSVNVSKPTNASTVILSGNSLTQDVVNAPENSGMGVWTNAFGKTIGADETSENASVTLRVPGETKKAAGEKYVTTLTWTLTDTPD